MRRVALLAAIGLAVLAATQVGGAGASLKGWQLLIFSLKTSRCSANPSPHVGSARGECDGKISAGLFETADRRVHIDYAGRVAKFTWIQPGATLDVQIPVIPKTRIDQFRGTMHDSWQHLTITDGLVDGVQFVSGTSAPTGHPDGPLHALLVPSGRDWKDGFTLAVHGYLRPR
jgi:hypothetical protein